MKKTVTYSAFGLGAAYLLGKNGVGITVKKKKITPSLKTFGNREWCYLYRKGRRVFDCNPRFFKVWFRREK